MQELKTCVTLKPIDLKLWHERLSHLNNALVKQLANSLAKGIALNPLQIDNWIYDPCFQCKQHMATNRTPEMRVWKSLELIHSDHAGPFPSSLAGTIYFVIYIHEYNWIT